MDAYVLEKIQEALKNCHAKNKINLDFYEELKEILDIKEAKLEETNVEAKTETDEASVGKQVMARFVACKLHYYLNV